MIYYSIIRAQPLIFYHLHPSTNPNGLFGLGNDCSKCGAHAARQHIHHWHPRPFPSWEPQALQVLVGRHVVRAFLSSQAQLRVTVLGPFSFVLQISDKYATLSLFDDFCRFKKVFAHKPTFQPLPKQEHLDHLWHYGVRLPLKPPQLFARQLRTAHLRYEARI